MNDLEKLYGMDEIGNDVPNTADLSITPDMSNKNLIDITVNGVTYKTVSPHFVTSTTAALSLLFNENKKLHRTIHEQHGLIEGLKSRISAQEGRR